MRQKRPDNDAIATLKADIDKGLKDLEEGRVEDFDAKEIMKRGREILKRRGQRK